MHSDAIITGNKVKSINEIKFPSESLYRMVLFKNASQLLITDEIKSLLHLFDIDGQFLQSINPEQILQQPLGLYVLIKEFDEEIYVGDCFNHQIFVFDSNFLYKNQFGDERIKVPQFMEIDTQSKNNLIYISDIKDDEITVWNYEKGDYIGKIEIVSPLEMKFNNDNLFVTSGISFKLNESTNKVECIEKGCNSIFLFDKIYPFQLKREIKNDEWLSLSTLHITTNRLIYTIAYEVDRNGVKSEFKNFYTVDEHGNLLKKVLLDGIKYLCDVVFLKNKIFICSKNEIKIIQFYD